jgi:sec-independent protein translocase protein TatA
MFGLGLWEGLIVLAVVLLLFGGKKLPQLGSAMGKSLVNFKKGLKEGSKEDEEASKDDEQRPS